MISGNNTLKDFKKASAPIQEDITINVEVVDLFKNNTINRRVVFDENKKKEASKKP